VIVQKATVAALGQVPLWSLEREVFLGVLGRSGTGPMAAFGADGASPHLADAGLIV
jgi:hypothetical protein